MRALHLFAAVLTATLAAAYAPTRVAHASARPAATGRTTVQTGLVYGRTRAGATLRLDLHVPEVASTSAAMIWLHGTRPTSPRSRMGYYAEHFAQLGYVSATIDYSYDGARDAQTAVAYFRRHADQLGIDPDRIFVGGYSYGAIVSIAAGENAPVARRPDGIVSIAGYSKTMHPTASSAPLLALHGDRDPNVPYSLGVGTCNAWKRAGAPCRLYTLHGAAHSAITWSRRGQIWPATDRWLRQRIEIAGGQVPGSGPGGGVAAPSVVDDE
jgi:predicted esterase